MTEKNKNFSSERDVNPARVPHQKQGTSTMHHFSE